MPGKVTVKPELKFDFGFGEDCHGLEWLSIKSEITNRQQQYEQAISNLETIITQKTDEIDEVQAGFAVRRRSILDYYYLLAQSYANTGKHQDAIACCQKALQIDSFAVPIHYLLAQITEELITKIEATL